MDLFAILAGIQDDAAKKEIQALADRAKHADQLDADMQGKVLVEQAKADGWTKFDQQWNAGLKDQVANAQKLAAENATLKAENLRLKPEAERAAILAAQQETGTVDHDKIAALIETKFADRLLTPERERAIREAAVAEAKQKVDFGSIPAATTLLENIMRAKDEFGLRISAEDFATAANRHGGFDQAYAILTKDAREKLAADKAAADKAAYDKAIADAEARGAARERLAFETNSTYEEAGGSGASVLPMSPPTEGNGPVIDPKTYDPSQGVLAREAGKLLQQMETQGGNKTVM